MIYLSVGTNWFDEYELKDILAISNTNNSRDNITGMLLYGDGNFIQLLEGEESDVKMAFERISFDNRHKDVTLIVSGLLKTRNFAQWAMGFKSVKALSLASFEGYLNPADPSVRGKIGGQIAVNLTEAFKRPAGMAV